jgi:hypothetical protein
MPPAAAADVPDRKSLAFGHAGMARMDVRVDDAGEDVLPGGIEGGGAVERGAGRLDGGDPPPAHGDIGRPET